MLSKVSSFLRKLKKLFKAINLKNIKSVLRYIKKNGFKGLYTTCISHIRFGKTILDEYATWMANNEPNTEELEKQKKYVSCQDLQFTFVIPKSSTEKLKNSIKEQTYSKFKIEEFENQEEIKNITNSESDYTILSSGNIELAPFTLYEIVKSIEYRDIIMLYTDNDKIIEGKREKPHFKPGFGKRYTSIPKLYRKLLVIKTNFLKAHSEILEI